MTADRLPRLRVEVVDPEDPASFRPLYDVYAAASRHGETAEFATVWQPEEVRVALADPDERKFRTAWCGWVRGEDSVERVAATGWVQGSRVDNTELLDVVVCCAPLERGRGYATAMLAHVEEQARALGRRRLLAEVTWPYALGATGEGSPELGWAVRRGFALGLVDVQRRLALPVAPGLLDELAAEAAGHHEGYELRSFTGPVPDDLVEGWAALAATLVTEAPTGDIAREVETPDVGAVRAEEDMLARQGRVRLGTAARTRPAPGQDPEVVAYTDLVHTEHESVRAYQWGTLVRPGHRGHRLGLATKVANLRLLQDTQPQVETVVTFNADVNAPMVAVNERLGYRPVQWLGELEKRLD